MFKPKCQILFKSIVLKDPKSSWNHEYLLQLSVHIKITCNARRYFLSFNILFWCSRMPIPNSWQRMQVEHYRTHSISVPLPWCCYLLRNDGSDIIETICVNKEHVSTRCCATLFFDCFTFYLIMYCFSFSTPESKQNSNIVCIYFDY